MTDISSQDLFADAAGDIKPLMGFAISSSRSTDAWRQDIMQALVLLGATDETVA